MPVLSFEKGVDASYSVAAGQTTVTIRSNPRLNCKAIYSGTGQMLFHWVQEGKTEAWRCDISLANAGQAQTRESTGQDGSQDLEVALGTVYPAGFFLRGRMEGVLIAPAVHVQLPWWRDVWVFLIRSPWFPLRLQVGRPSLSVKHDSSEVTASIGAAADGSASGQIAFNGPDFKSASLVLRRTIGSYSSDEPVCEATSGVQAFSWKPILRAFDLLLVTGGHISESQLADLAKGLGAELSSGILGAGSVQGAFVLCDGPALSYSWVLKGHRGFLENMEDRTDTSFIW